MNCYPADTFSLIMNLIPIFGLIYVIQLHFLLKKLKKHETQEWKKIRFFYVDNESQPEGCFFGTEVAIV